MVGHCSHCCSIMNTRVDVNDLEINARIRVGESDVGTVKYIGEVIITITNPFIHWAVHRRRVRTFQLCDQRGYHSVHCIIIVYQYHVEWRFGVLSLRQMVTMTIELMMDFSFGFISGIRSQITQAHGLVSNGIIRNEANTMGPLITLNTSTPGKCIMRLFHVFVYVHVRKSLCLYAVLISTCAQLQQCMCNTRTSIHYVNMYMESVCIWVRKLEYVSLEYHIMNGHHR